MATWPDSPTATWPDNSDWSGTHEWGLGFRVVVAVLGGREVCVGARGDLGVGIGTDGSEG